MALQNSINNFTPLLSIVPSAGQDAAIQWSNSTDFLRMGIDEDDNDYFKLSLGASIGTNDCFLVTQDGYNLKPLQPAFSAYRNSADSNVTGNGASYSCTFDVISYDQNSDFDGTTFTCPVDGRYMFDMTYSFQGVTAAMTRALLRFTPTAPVNFMLNSGSAGAQRDNLNQYGASHSILIELDAADTVSLVVILQNGAGNTADFGTPNTASVQVTAFFSGSLKF